MCTKESNCNPLYSENISTRLSEIFNNYKEKQSVPKACTAALIESEATTP